MQPDPRFKFHALVIGQGQSKFLVISRQPLNLEILPGVRVLVEAAAKADLVAALSSVEGQVLVRAWGVSQGLISRSRAALGLAASNTGDSRTTAWRRTGKAPGKVAVFSLPTGKEIPDSLAVTVLGDASQQAVIVGCWPVAWEMAEKGNFLIQSDDGVTKEQFRLWLQNGTIAERAAALDVARNVILYARHHLGVVGHARKGT